MSYEQVPQEMVQNTTPTYPQSEQGNTPPPMALPAFHDNIFPQPPPSPTNYPRTTVNTPIPSLCELDPDTTMATPQMPHEIPNTQTQTPATTPHPNVVNTPNLDNSFGLGLQFGMPETPPTKKTIFTQLEEAATDQASSGKHPA